MDFGHRYYFELGRFVDQFARVEKSVQLILFMSAEVDIVHGRALFAGTKNREAIALIRKLHESRAGRLPADIEDAFKQLLEINSTRDALVHWGVRRSPYSALDSLQPEDSADEVFLLSNSLTAYSRRLLRGYPMSPVIVHCMSNDLRTIEVKLEMFLLDLNGGGPKQAGRTALAARPWFYKPPQVIPFPQAPRSGALARQERQP
ncbi:hypothetical protein GCM10027034_14990 [Ramlibacter solisilvae]|uniref:hypothetical protein n=1 Tax=Ramlibacter tataouinensis TaxID=94132 RepID=UPI0011AE8A4F|nr:hypothetical protein [Ramlibacter tataouinensis]